MPAFRPFQGPFGALKMFICTHTISSSSSTCLDFPSIVSIRKKTLARLRLYFAWSACLGLLWFRQMVSSLAKSLQAEFLQAEFLQDGGLQRGGLALPFIGPRLR